MDTLQAMLCSEEPGKLFKKSIRSLVFPRNTSFYT